MEAENAYTLEKAEQILLERIRARFKQKKADGKAKFQKNARLLLALKMQGNIRTNSSNNYEKNNQSLFKIPQGLPLFFVYFLSVSAIL